MAVYFDTIKWSWLRLHQDAAYSYIPSRTGVKGYSPRRYAPSRTRGVCGYWDLLKLVTSLAVMDQDVDGAARVALFNKSVILAPIFDDHCRL